MTKFIILKNNIIVNPFKKSKRNVTSEKKECFYCRHSKFTCPTDGIGTYCDQFIANYKCGELNYSPTDIDDYMGKINISDVEEFLLDDANNEETSLRIRQALQLLNHCNKHDIKPEICAWYDDIYDLFDDYKEHCNYTKSETKEILKKYPLMFCRFFNGEIVKLVY